MLFLEVARPSQTSA